MQATEPTSIKHSPSTVLEGCRRKQLTNILKTENKYQAIETSFWTDSETETIPKVQL